MADVLTDRVEPLSSWWKVAAVGMAGFRRAYSADCQGLPERAANPG